MPAHHISQPAIAMKLSAKVARRFDHSRQDRDASGNSVLPRRARQPAGVHVDLDGGCRPQRRRQGSGDRVSDSAFVAAGFEHSIANMYVIPLAILVQPAGGAITRAGVFHNKVPVIAGNLVGGSVFEALVHRVILFRPARSGPPGAQPS